MLYSTEWPYSTEMLDSTEYLIPPCPPTLCFFLTRAEDARRAERRRRAQHAREVGVEHGLEQRQRARDARGGVGRRDERVERRLQPEQTPVRRAGREAVLPHASQRLRREYERRLDAASVEYAALRTRQ